MAQLLHPSDYAIFVAVLALSLGIGIFTSLRGSRQTTTSEYLLGGRQMALLPITLSMAVSFVSSNTFMGYPAESYSFGIQLWVSVIGTVLGMTLACFLYVGVFYNLNLTSITEYLEMRYESRLVRILGSVSTIIGSFWYAGSVFYGPSTAIESVTGVPAWAAILISSAVCVIYTTIGGFKAVVWTDAFQTLVMICGMLAVFIQGLILTGGMEEVFTVSKDWGRLNFFVLDPDPTIRLTLWGVIIGETANSICAFGFNQVAVQRYSSLPSVGKARAAILLSIPGIILLLSTAAFSGLIIFTYFTKQGCDPVADGHLNNANQIIFYFIAQALNSPPLPGLFLASTTAASLSTVSSLLNSNAAILWKDFVCRSFPRLSERKTAARTTKVLVLVNGILATGMALVIATIGGTILQMAQTVISATVAPLCALYFMGVFMPWVNYKGAVIGSVITFILGSWLAIGSFTVKSNWTPLPTNTEFCDSRNFTTSMYSILTPEVTTMQDESSSHPVLSPSGREHLSWVQRYLYSLSFSWLLPIFLTVCVILTNVFSAVTGFRSPATVEKRLVHPAIHWLFTLKENSLELGELNATTNLESKPGTNNIMHESVLLKDDHLVKI